VRRGQGLSTLGPTLRRAGTPKPGAGWRYRSHFGVGSGLNRGAVPGIPGRFVSSDGDELCRFCDDLAVRRVLWGGWLALVVVFAGCGGSGATFPAGSGSVTITWLRVGGAPGDVQPFQGTIAGQNVTGKSVLPTSQSLISPVLGVWTGTFEGTSFHLTLSTSGVSPASGGLSPVLTVDGSFGSQVVLGTAALVPNSQEIGFRIAVGHHHIAGTVENIVEYASTAEATAKFTVTS